MNPTFRTFLPPILAAAGGGATAFLVTAGLRHLLGGVLSLRERAGADIDGVAPCYRGAAWRAGATLFAAWRLALAQTAV